MMSCFLLRGGVSRRRGLTSPRSGRVLFSRFSILGIGWLAFYLKQKKKRIIRIKMIEIRVTPKCLGLFPKSQTIAYE